MNILIVEDDARVADFLERGLRAEGYRVQVARNGTDGLAKARDVAQQMRNDATPAVLVLDVMLPGMTGLEVCQTLRADGVQLPILMLSALGALEDRVAGLRLGADDYLAKPFAFEELLALLELLMSAPGRLFSRERILANVWGTNEDPLTNVVDVYIRRLRGKIDDGNEQPLIHTVRGLGYRLEAG